MGRYVALIRGIGPGDPRKSNESLRDVLTDLGFTDVRSVISSGNVIFSSDDAGPDTSRVLGERIEAAWPEKRGFTATTIVRSREQLAALVDALPYGDAPHSRDSYQLVTFFTAATAPAKAVEPPETLEMTSFGLIEGALCTLSSAATLPGTDLMAWLERTYGREITSRTSLTLRRILAKM